MSQQIYMLFYRYAVTFNARNGGFRIFDNDGGKQYYTGRQASRSIELKFDTETPYHCSQKGECSDSSTMMKITNDVTKVLMCKFPYACICTCTGTCLLELRSVQRKYILK